MSDYSRFLPRGLRDGKRYALARLPVLPRRTSGAPVTSSSSPEVRSETPSVPPEPTAERHGLVLA